MSDRNTIGHMLLYLRSFNLNLIKTETFKLKTALNFQMAYKKLSILFFPALFLLITGCSIKKNLAPDISLFSCAISSHQDISDKTTEPAQTIQLEKEGDQQFFAKNYDNALVCYNRALELRTKKVGLNHLSLIPSLYNLATVYEVKQDYKAANSFYARSMKILKKQKQLSSYNAYLGFLTATYCANITSSNIKSLQNSLLAFRQIHDPNNIRVAAIQHRMAIIYLTNKNFSKAENTFKKAISVLHTYTGNNHPYYAKIINDFANLLELTDRTKQALELKKQAAVIFQSYPKKLHTKLYSSE